MRRFITAALAAILAVAAPITSFADTRVVVYPQQNPLDSQQNSNARFERVTVGGFMNEALGTALATTGTYANLTCSPGTGLFITVAPTLSNSTGGVYQRMANDPNPLPSGAFASPSPLPTALPADNTIVMVRGAQAVTTAPFGPLTAPGGGLKTYYLLEAALASQDGNAQSIKFITNTGTSFFQTVNTNRNDVIVYTLKAGTPAASPTPVPADAGNVAICQTLIPNGKSQVLTGDITMSPAFTGWLSAGSAILLSPTSSPSPQAGNAAIAGQFAANQLISTVATGTAPINVASTTLVPNLQAATAAQLTTTPVGTAPITVTGTTALTIACATCVAGLTAGLNMVVGSGTTPTVATTAAPSFTNLTVAGGVTLSSLLSGCLQTNGSGVVSTTTCSASAVAYNGSAPIVVATPGGSVTYSCPTCVTSVAAGSNMVVSPSGGPTPTVAVTNAPTFTGPAKVQSIAFTTPTSAPTASSAYISNGGSGGIIANVATGQSLSVNVAGSSVTTINSTGVNTNNVNVSGLTASLPVCTDGSKNLTTSGCSGGAAPTLFNANGAASVSGYKFVFYNASGTVNASCIQGANCSLSTTTTTFTGGAAFASNMWCSIASNQNIGATMGWSVDFGTLNSPVWHGRNLETADLNATTFAAELFCWGN